MTAPIVIPVAVTLGAAVAYFLYNKLRTRDVIVQLPQLRKDFTVSELEKFDKTQPERILLNVNQHIYDVSKDPEWARKTAALDDVASRRKLLTMTMLPSAESSFRESHDIVGRLLQSREDTSQNFTKDK